MRATQSLRAISRLSAMVLLAGCYTGLGLGASSVGDGGEADGPGGTADGGDGGTTDGPGELLPEEFGRVATSGLRRLSVREYEDTVRDLLTDPEIAAAQQLPPDPLSPFDNDYRHQIASSGLIDATEFLATRAADALAGDTARRDAIVGCQPSGPDDEACMRSFLSRFGRRVFRRPLTDDELDEYLHGSTGADGVLSHAIAANDFYVGVDTLVRSLLQDPQFLYRVEVGTPVPGQPGVFELSQFELATRMSYFLWGSTPDDKLLDRAEAGELDSPAAVRAAAEEMLADPRAIARAARFHALWLGYAALPHSAELNAAMQTEADAVLARVLFEERLPWMEVFRFEETFVSDMLAELYGLPKPGSSEPTWVEYGDSGRRGLLSQGSFLSIGAKANDTNAVRRGKFITERLMCKFVPPPPPDVNTDEPINEEGAICKPDVLAVHRQGGCASCHAMMDPIGLGLENYDQLGRFRELEPDNPDTPDDESQCTIPGDGEIVNLGAFRGPAELADLLLEKGGLSECAVAQAFSFVSGHSILPTGEVNGFDEFDGAFVEAMLVAVGDGELRFDELVLEIVSDKAFRFRREEEV